VDLWQADRHGKQAALRLMSGLRVELGVLTMQDIKQRREEIAQQLRDPRTREEIIQRLKTLMGLRPDEPLPNGTPIITTLIKLEEEQLRTRSQKNRITE